MKVEVTLETVTPLFLGGADPRGQPELRVPSLRGALRFWLRALLAGSLGDDRLDALRERESAVFGSTKGASNVELRIKPGDLHTVSFASLAEWNQATRNYTKPGISYLFFSARRAGSGPERSAIAPASVINLTVSTRANLVAGDNGSLQHACAALWLLTRVGGLGARCRRGAGSLQITKAEGTPTELPSLIVQADTPTGLQAELRDGLSRLRPLLDTAANFNRPAAFDILHPDICNIWVLDAPFHSWSMALDAIGRAMQQFRNRREPDYKNVKGAVQGGRLTQPVRRAAFGLPIVFYYKSLQRQGGTLEGEYHDRRASPLMVRITKLASGKFAIVLTLFQSELLPPGEQLKIQQATADAPDLSLIDDFLRELDNMVAPRLEVAGW